MSYIMGVLFCTHIRYILNTALIYILLPNIFCCTESDFLLLPQLFICEAHLAIALFLLILFVTRIVTMRMCIFYATNLIKKLKERVH